MPVPVLEAAALAGYNGQADAFCLSCSQTVQICLGIEQRHHHHTKITTMRSVDGSCVLCAEAAALVQSNYNAKAFAQAMPAMRAFITAWAPVTALLLRTRSNACSERIFVCCLQRLLLWYSIVITHCLLLRLRSAATALANAWATAAALSLRI